MVLRKKNLLDAFREAAPEGRKSASAQGHAAPSSSGAGGPFAPAPSSPPPSNEPVPAARFEPAETDLPAARTSAMAGLLADPKYRLIGLLTLLIGIGAYFVGRFGAKPARAADSTSSSGTEASGKGASGPGAAAGASAAMRNQAAARMGSALDQAFMDPANRFTVRLIQYNNDEEGQKLARQTADFLKKQAIPVVSPVSKGKWIILCAGAKPRREELDGLQKLVKSQHGAPPLDKQLPFTSAYIDNIDAVVQRQ